MYNVPQKIDGVSNLPANEWNDHSDEVEYVVTSSGQSLTGSPKDDTTQMAKASSIYGVIGDYYTDTGTADNYIFTPEGAREMPPIYENGEKVRVILANPNGGACVAKRGSLLDKSIKLEDGTTDPAAGQLPAGKELSFTYSTAGGGKWIFNQPTGVLPQGYWSGQIPSNNGVDSDHDIDISAGAVRSSDNTQDIILSSTLTKRIDANWAEGNNQGGFPSGLTLTANTVYHFYTIAKITGQVDGGYDSSLTAANLLADATGYTKYRRRGFIFTDASLNIVGINTTDDYTKLKTPRLITSLTTMPTTQATYPCFPSSPSVKVEALIDCNFTTTGSPTLHGYLQSPDNDDFTITTSPVLYNFVVDDDLGSEAFQREVITNTAGQIAIKADSASGHDCNFLLVGWKNFF